MKLRCIAPYRNDVRGVIYRVGDVFEVTAKMKRFLLADAPGCFEEVIEGKAPDAPPANKMMAEPMVKKTPKRRRRSR